MTRPSLRPVSNRKSDRFRSLAVLALAALAVAYVAAAPSASSNQAFTGHFFLGHADDFGAANASYQPMLELDDGTELALDLQGVLPPDVRPGTPVVVRGIRQNDRLAVSAGSDQIAAASGSTSSTSSTTTAAAAATGSRRIAVVLFNFSNDTSQPYTQAFANGVAFTNPDSVAAYYDTNSGGKLTLSGDVFGWYTIADSNTSCNTSTWASSASKAAVAAGVNLSGYDNVVYAFPSVSSCAWAGWAEIPGRNSWLNGADAMSLGVMGHELGHNFGTHHASSLSCTESGVKVALSASSGNCTTGEYGDPFSIMGGAAHFEHTNFSRGNLGWLSAANTQAVTASGDYLLKPVELNDSTAVKVLRIKRTSSTYLTLEFRQPSGVFDSFAYPTTSATSGVTIRIAPDYGTITQSQLVDATPGSSMSFFDAPLAVGKSLTDPLTGVSITTVSTGSAGATVHVSFGGSGGGTTTDTAAPGQPGSLTAAATSTSAVSLSWTASTDNVGVAGYRVYRNSVLVATVTSPGYADSGLTAGTTYGYQVVAFDAAGNSSSAASTSATTAAGDTQAPAQPGSLTATPVDSTHVALAWTTSTDNVGVVGYRVLRNATLVATVTSLGYADSGLAPSTTYAYQVVAIDAVGNVSPAASASVTTLANTAQPGDTTAPTAPVNLAAAFQPRSTKKVGLRWTASTDNVGVAGYRVYRNGAQVATTTTTSYTDTLAGKTSKPGYYVVAYDAAGNVSPASNTASP